MKKNTRSIDFVTIPVILALLLSVVIIVPTAAAQQTVCANPYIVESGDTLSGIAADCGTTVQALVDANPAITDASLIYPGQNINIPNGAIIPDTGQQASIQLFPTSGPAGAIVGVTGSGFPANVPAAVAVRAQGAEARSTQTINTGADGSFSTQVMIPEDAAQNSLWDITARLQGAGLSVTQTFAVTPDATGGTYTVVEGDTLASIANRFGTSVQALLRANPQIENGAVITPGMTLAIPGSVVIPDTGAETYLVKSGDTLSGIAVRFGTTVNALLEMNPQITDPSLIYPGQRIMLPQSTVVIPDTGAQTYIVQQGDTLTTLAERFGTTEQAILDANPQMETAQDLIVGRQIFIPNGNVVIPDTGAQSYTIQSGDTLSELATQFGTTVDALLQANPQITNENLIYTGQTLVIP